MPTVKETGSSSAAALAEALRAMVRQEVSAAVATAVEDAVAGAVAELKSTLDERLSTLPTGGEGGGFGKEEFLAAAPQLCALPQFQQEIRRQLEDAFQGVLPGLVKRLRGEIEKRIQSGESAGGGGAALTIKTVVSSSELKEVLEERFRTMLAYLKQEVIPLAIRQGG
jgi:hypothetical protein